MEARRDTGEGEVGLAGGSMQIQKLWLILAGLWSCQDLPFSFPTHSTRDSDPFPRSRVTVPFVLTGQAWVETAHLSSASAVPAGARCGGVWWPGPLSFLAIWL